MRISFKKFPIDIILCIIWSFLLIPVAFLDVEGIVRILLGLPFVLFIPGYVLIFALFPAIKKEKGIDVVERIALSFGLSVAIIPLIGFILNYTPFGIRIESIFLSVFIFIIGVGSIAIYRWIKTKPNERFIILLKLSVPKYESKMEKALIVILSIFIIIALASLIYVIANPKTGESFTEFYILGPTGETTGYPHNLIIGQDASVIIGLKNHEYKTINYTIEIWLINQTIIYNESTNVNETIYNHMWFIDKINIMLTHAPADIERSWEPQWEYNYTFNIDKPGENFKLAFLLFTRLTGDYSFDKDYKDIAEQRISGAYREIYLYINVT